MKDYYNVLPDKTKLLNKHYTPGRAREIEYITRHHLAMVGTTEQVWEVWLQRPASAHYVVEPDGTVGQIVYDRDTAWSNANADSNARSIAIEHSNSGGAAQDWPISDTVIKSGARLAAALCLYYKLGRPVFGKNIRDHREFGQTSCPYHLAHGGKYHKAWMDEAQRFYDLLVAKKVTATGAPITAPTSTMTPQKGNDMTAEQYAKDNKAQLTGSPRLGEYPGWPQLGGRTLVDAVAAIGAKLDIDGFKDVKEGK